MIFGKEKHNKTVAFFRRLENCARRYFRIKQLLLAEHTTIATAFLLTTLENLMLVIDSRVRSVTTTTLTSYVLSIDQLLLLTL